MHCIATCCAFVHAGSHSTKNWRAAAFFCNCDMWVCEPSIGARWQWHASSAFIIVAGLSCMQISDYPIVIPSHHEIRIPAPCLEYTLSRPHFESPLSCAICYCRCLPSLKYGEFSGWRSTRVNNNWSSNPMGAESSHFRQLGVMSSLEQRSKYASIGCLVKRNNLAHPPVEFGL